MSDRPRERASPSSNSNRPIVDTRTDVASSVGRQANPAANSTAFPSDQHASRPLSVAPSASPTSHQPTTLGNGRTMELPPLPRAPNVAGGSFSPASRSAGVLSMLNPTAPDDEAPSRRRKASQLDSPSSAAPTLPPLSTSTTSSHVMGGFRSSSPMTLPSSVSDRSSRRILTPRSPSLQRAVSLNQLNPPTGAINAQQSPFPTSPRARAYGMELGHSGAAPPMPTPPAAVRQSYGFSAPTPTSQSSRRTSTGPVLGARPASESTSPKSSYSSYSQLSQTSPGPHYASSSMPTLSAPYMNGADLGSLDRQRPMGVPITSSGSQNVYQIMTLETTSGTVQLPVDVQAASRMADEKRRRNAGASARFRQRRKEKEREASTTISRLEQEVKELRDDMDFYKRERDYLAGVVLQAPGGDRHFPRPKSPYQYRHSSVGMGGGGLGSSSSAGCIPSQAQAPRSPSDGRNVRRRTSGMSLPPPQQQASTPMPAPGVPYQTNYPPQAFGPPLAPQSQTTQQGAVPLPSPLGRPSFPPHGLPAPPQLMQASPQTGPWNPYASSDRRSAGPSN